MPTQLKPSEVQAALIAALKAVLTSPIQVRGLTSRDITTDGNIIVVPPAVLVLLDAGEDAPAPNALRLDYLSTQRYLLLCGQRNLKDEDSERGEALDLLANVRDALAGLDMTIGDPGVEIAPIELGGFERFQFDANGTWYAQAVHVQERAQFTPK